MNVDVEQYIPKSDKIKFDTSTLDVLVDGLSEVYGRNKKVKLNCKSVDSSPQFLFNDKFVSASIKSGCVLAVEKANSYENAINFSIIADFSGEFRIEDGSNLFANIGSLVVRDSTIISTKVPKVNIKNIESLIDFASNIGVPLVNKQLLTKPIKIWEPYGWGINFKDATVSLKPQYIVLNASPKLGEILKKN